MNSLIEAAEIGGVAEMEAVVDALRPSCGGRVSYRRWFTSADQLEIVRRPEWAPELAYFHNGVRIERDRAVDLIGERG